jgi:hypothetical protein
MTRCLLAVGLAVVSLATPSSARAQLDADHLFVVVSPGAPESRALEDAGFLKVPEVAKHTGQGTASVFFVFDNAYLELLWIEDAETLRAADSGLAERFESVASGTSPFGIGLRRSGPETEGVPFATRAYIAEWMMPGTEIRIAQEQPLREPMIFVVPPYMAWTPSHARYGVAMNHENGARSVTSIRVSGPGMSELSEPAGYLNRHGIVEISDADRPLLKIELDAGRSGKVLDGRPDLPLVIRY